MHRLYFCVFLLLFGFIASATGSEAVTIRMSNGAQQPQVVVDHAGGIHLTFGSKGSIFYTYSTDEGASYAEPIRIATLKALALGMRRGPRIAVVEKSIVLTAIGGEQGGGRDGDLLCWRSEDKGRTWHGPSQVNDVTRSAREGLHGMAASPKGEIFCVWLDLRSKGTQIFGSRSTDGGATWSENELVYKSPGGSVCECCHPSVVYDDRGVLHVMWRNSLRGNRDMFWMTSEDGGKTFGEAAKLGRGSWKLKACPMDGGAIAVHGKNGKIAAAWRRDKDVFLTANQPSDERMLGTGVQPWVAADEQRLYSVWLTGRPGDLYLAISDQDQPIKLANGARDPVVGAAAIDRGPVVVAWEDDENGQSVIKAKNISGDSR